MPSISRDWSCENLRFKQAICVLVTCSMLAAASSASAAISSAGDIAPVPPSAGGSVTGPLRIGIDDVGSMSISGGTLLTSSGAAILGDDDNGLGIVSMAGFLSDWTLSSGGADLTVGNGGTGSLSLLERALLTVNDDLFVAAQPNSLGEINITDLGTIVDVGDDANIGQRGQAVVGVFAGGRLLTDANIIGDEALSEGRVTVSDQLSLWRATSTMTIADAGRALLQVFDGARVENTSAVIANLAGSTGTAEVVGLGAVWQNSLGLTVGELGQGTLLVGDGGRVSVGTGSNPFLIGRQSGAVGRVEVSGLDSLLTAGTTEVGDSGDGTLWILHGGRVASSTALVGDNSNSRGEVLVQGAGATWDINGELNVSDPGEAHLTIADGGLVRTGTVTRVNALGRITLDGGRLEMGGTTALLNSGVIEGGGTIEGLLLNNNLGGQIRTYGPRPLLLIGSLTNAALLDIQAGELEVTGATSNNSDIDARDGAVLRFRGPGLDNNAGAQLAITSGIVDVFGLVDNNAGAEIAVGGTAVAVFHDAVANNGTIFVQPGGEVLTLENLTFSPDSVLRIALQAIDLMDPGTDPSDAFGQVQVAGAATLAGTLQVALQGGYTPVAGDMFQILTAGTGRSEEFDDEILPPLAGGLSWNVLYNPNSVVLSVVSAGVPGDYNNDGLVDAADYVVWRKNVGTSNPLPNDPAGGLIGPAQYATWRNNFGNTAGSGAANAAVPEPASLALACVAALASIAARRGCRLTRLFPGVPGCRLAGRR